MPSCGTDLIAALGLEPVAKRPAVEEAAEIVEEDVHDPTVLGGDRARRMR